MINSNAERIIIDLSNVSNVTELGIKITSVLESTNTTNKELFLKLGNLDLKQSQLLSIKALIEAMQLKLAGIETQSEITETAAIGLGLIVGAVQQNIRQSFDDSFKLDEETMNVLTKNNDSEEELSSFSQLKKLNSVGDFVTDTKNLEEIKDENIQTKTEEFLKEAEIKSSIEQSETEQENIYDALNKTSTPDDIQDALDATFGAATRINIQKEDNDETKEEENIIPRVDITSQFEELKVDNEPVIQIQAEEKQEDYEITELREKTEESKYVLLDTDGITPEGIELIRSNTSDLPTLYLTQTLRSGQTVSYEGNIFLIGDAHPGSEINATGDVTIWGILGGIVHAGYKGNTDAKVRALKLNPIQLRIANLYSRRNDTVNVPYVQKSNEFTPEEARIENEQIVIYKTLRRED